MTKKKKTQTRKPQQINGVDESEFLQALENISKRLGNKFKFGYHTYEDMKQQAAIFAIEGLERYDHTRPLENFLWTHVRNRLFNYKRDHYQRPDVPCLTCPFFKKPDGCSEFDDRNECSLYSSWTTRNSTKKNIMKPIGIDNLEYQLGSEGHDTVAKEQIFEIIDNKLPSQYRELYLRYRYGDKLTKSEQSKIVNIIREILGENNE